MNAQTNMTAADARLMAASEWVLRLQGPDVDEKTMAEWLEWCEADKENLAAFEGAREVWQRFDDKQLSDSLALAVAPEKQTRVRGIRALAASLAVVVAGGVWFLSARIDRTVYTQSLSTAVASLSRQTLPDGSTVELGARSAVRVNLTEDRRGMIVDDGEAFFNVAKDPHRPFVVDAGEVQVTALGTAFNVRKTADRIVITVKEGKVRVASSPASLAGEGREGAIAVAGHQVTYSKQNGSLLMTRIDTPAPKPAAWQVGGLQFVNEPLASVIADVNRYSPRPIALADPQLGTLIFTGTLRRDAIDDWLSGLAQIFPVDVVDKAEEGIVLTGRTTK